MSDNPLQAARFVVAAHQISQLPLDTGVEIAFAGRSNSGKSSAINTLTAQKSLARTSRTPGRTQQMVAFALDHQRRLIDLPGYGYAKAPEAMRAHWRQEIDGYLRRRRSLRGIVLMADIRHELKEFDRTMLAFCAAMALPCLLLMTKADKLPRQQAARAVDGVRRICRQQDWPAQVLPFSAHTGAGVGVARAAVVEMLQAACD